MRRHLRMVGRNFIPGVAGDILIDSEDNFTYTGYHASGDFSKWLKLAARLRQFPFVKKVMEAKEKEPGLFNESYDAVFKYFTQKWPDRILSYISAVSIVTLADILASEWIFGVSEELATE